MFEKVLVPLDGSKVGEAALPVIDQLVSKLAPGSKVVTDLALNGLEDLVGASFVVEPDPLKAAELLDQRIISKRKALGLS